MTDPSVDGVYIAPSFAPGTSMTTGFALGPVVVAVIALAISHGVSFWFNYLGRGEFRRTSAAAQMFAPYGRLVVLHITIILGGRPSRSPARRRRPSRSWSCSRR